MKRFFLALGFFGSTLLTVHALETVEQWGRFEIALNGPTNGNPFLDVKFSAKFTRGTDAVTANGFYDGDGIYRVRFMPEKSGEWHYVTKSSSASLDGKTGEFSVMKPVPDNHGPVRVAWPWTTTTKRALCAGCSALSVIALVSVVAGKIRWYSGAAPTTSNKGLDAFVRSWAAQSSLPSPSHARDPQHAREGGNDEK